MKRIFSVIVFTAIFMTGGCMAIADNLEQPFNRGELNPYNKFFTGLTYLSRLSENDSTWNSSIANVTFEPSARTNWHKHSGGQILLVTAGEGRYQEKDKPVQIIKKGDTVKVIAGKDKGREGKVTSVKDGKVIIEGINQVTKHTKPNQANPQGGIVQKSAPLDISNVMYLHKGKATRVGFKMDGDKKVRFAKTTGEVID